MVLGESSQRTMLQTVIHNSIRRVRLSMIAQIMAKWMNFDIGSSTSRLFPLPRKALSQERKETRLYAKSQITGPDLPWTNSQATLIISYTRRLTILSIGPGGLR